MQSVTSNAVYNGLSDKVKHLALNTLYPAGETTGDKLKTILDANYNANNFEGNTAYVCTIEAGGYWFGFCTFSTTVIAASQAVGLAYCYGELLKIEFTSGAWIVSS